MLEEHPPYPPNEEFCKYNNNFAISKQNAKRICNLIFFDYLCGVVNSNLHCI